VFRRGGKLRKSEPESGRGWKREECDQSIPALKTTKEAFIKDSFAFFRRKASLGRAHGREKKVKVPTLREPRKGTRTRQGGKKERLTDFPPQSLPEFGVPIKRRDKTYRGRHVSFIVANCLLLRKGRTKGVHQGGTRPEGEKGPSPEKGGSLS